MSSQRARLRPTGPNRARTHMRPKVKVQPRRFAAFALIPLLVQLTPGVARGELDPPFVPLDTIEVDGNTPCDIEGADALPITPELIQQCADLLVERNSLTLPGIILGYQRDDDT